MTKVPAINSTINFKAATYNAVKIQVNEPKTNVSENFQSNPLDNGIYNAVSIEVNNPSVETNKEQKHNHAIYDYPCAECMVTSDFAQIHPITVPALTLPVAYQTSDFVIEETSVEAKNEPESTVIAEEIETETQENSVPEPNVVDVEEQNTEITDVNFQGLNFKANEAKHTIEIVPPEDIKPLVDIPEVISNLSDTNFDVQAKQMEEIAKVSMEDPQKAVPYIVTEVFSELINIVQKDTSSLVPPTERQIELRQQIIINELVKEEAKNNNQDPTKVELPHKLSDADIKEASELSSMEQAERNKEYALYTMAILSKVYTDEVHRHTGNVVPLTDMPGVSAIVDTLKNDANSSVKIAAIDALRYINRPEYKEEISAVLELSANDQNPYVARTAAVALEHLN